MAGGRVPPARHGESPRGHPVTASPFPLGPVARPGRHPPRPAASRTGWRHPPTTTRCPLGARLALTTALVTKASMAPRPAPAAARRKDTGDTGRRRRRPARPPGGGAVPPPSWSGAKPAPPSWGRAGSRWEGRGGSAAAGVGAGTRLFCQLPSPGVDEKSPPACRGAPPLLPTHPLLAVPQRPAQIWPPRGPVWAEEAVPHTNMAAWATTVAGRGHASY